MYFTQYTALQACNQILTRFCVDYERDDIQYSRDLAGDLNCHRGNRGRILDDYAGSYNVPVYIGTQ